MLAGVKKCGVIISSIPIIRSGLLALMKENFPEYELICHHSVDELTLLELRRATLIVSDLFGDRTHGKVLCEQYYSLMAQHKELRWIFMVSQANYALAVEYLLRPESTLLSDAEPIPQVIAAIRDRGYMASRISASLTTPDVDMPMLPTGKKASLSLSERQVLRLFAKGWGVNQIAMLLRKSNKTISAQKNSAMRRLMLRGNAELYAWLNSDQGMKELNLLPVWGEPIQWKSAPQIDTSQLLKTV
jgi:DNA-binding NarL/FixJ family response regulator